MTEAFEGGRLGGAGECKEYLEAQVPRMREEGVFLVVLGPKRSPLLGEPRTLGNPFLLVMLAGSAKLQERIEEWAAAIEADVTAYGGKKEGQWLEEKKEGVFSMSRRFIWL